MIKKLVVSLGVVAAGCIAAIASAGTQTSAGIDDSRPSLEEVFKTSYESDGICRRVVVYYNSKAYTYDDPNDPDCR